MMEEFFTEAKSKLDPSLIPLFLFLISVEMISVNLIPVAVIPIQIPIHHHEQVWEGGTTIIWIKWRPILKLWVMCISAL